VTDDRFDDYVDEESANDFVAEHPDAGSDVDADLETDSSSDSEVEAPRPGAWARPASTGVSSVDAAIEELARLDELPTSEHVAVYEGLHRQLQDALADLDGS
jgi:hypothetical protein